MGYRFRKIDLLNLVLLLVLAGIYFVQIKGSEGNTPEPFLVKKVEKTNNIVENDSTILKKNSLHISHTDRKYFSREKNGAEKVNINSDDLTYLATIPGVGLSTAKKMVAHRKRFGNFKTIYDLLEIKGIGKKKLDKMRNYIKINDSVGD